MKKTVKQLLNKHVKDEKLKTLIFATTVSTGSPSQLKYVPTIRQHGLLIEGAYYPKGGNQTISNAFVDVIKKNQGQILLKTEVSSIIVENNRAVGVTTKGGDKFFGKAIISNACATNTFRDLVGDDKLPHKFMNKLDNMVPSISSFGVFLGLDESFKATLKNTEDFEILVSETYNQDEDFQWILDADIEKSSFFITLNSNLDDTLAKDNKFVLLCFKNNLTVPGRNLKTLTMQETKRNTTKKKTDAQGCS